MDVGPMFVKGCESGFTSDSVFHLLFADEKLCILTELYQNKPNQGRLTKMAE